MNELGWSQLNPKQATKFDRFRTWLIQDTNQAFTFGGLVIMIFCAIGVSL